MHEGLQQDKLVLILVVNLLLQLTVEAEAVHQLLVMNRQYTHGSVEVLLELMQTKVDGLEVDLQLGRVGFLLSDLLLLLVSDLLLQLLGALLRETSLLLSLLALGLLDLVQLAELLERQRLRSRVEFKLFSFRQRLQLNLVFLSLQDHSDLHVNLDLAVRVFHGLLEVVVALIILDGLELDLVLRLVVCGELTLHFLEHLVLDLSIDIVLALLKMLLGLGHE